MPSTESRGRRLRAVYVTDTMADVRMLEGLAGHVDLTLLAPAGVGDRVTNYWPPRPPARVDRILLPGGRIPFLWRAAWWLARNRRRFDVAIVLDELVAALAANLARRLGGPPVVLQLGRSTVEYVRCQRGVRGRAAYTVRVLLASLVAAVNERLADAVGAISEHVAGPPRRRNRRVRIVRWYGVDTEVFAPRWSKAEARRRLGFPPDRPVVMLRSRIAPEKDPETFLRAVALLRAEGREFTAAYMGGEWEEFARLADAHGIDVVARAPDGMEEIPLWYVAATVDVQTSHVEGLGISPLESLACGTPIVVTDTGGLREVADGGDCGALVPPGDAEATARAIARFLDDPADGAAVARRGRRWVEERFEVQAAFRGWADLAREVAGGDGPGRRRVLFVDHEHRLSGGQRDLVDLVRALGTERNELHVALPVEGELAAALRAEGVDVHVVEMPEALRRVSRWDLARRPHRVAGQLWAAAASAGRVARLARRLRPDVVHANSLKAHVLALPAARLSRARFVWHVRDILDGRLGRLWSALAGACADRVVCLSEAAAESFRSGRAARRTRVVYNGVRPAVPDPAEVTGWRSRLSGGGPLVGIVGQLARWKGQDVFVEAAARLAKEDDDVRFAIVGSCLFPENEADYVAELHERVEALGLAERLTFVGQVDPVEPAMAAFDVLVHASRLPEPFGRVIVEAMAVGVPVVASASGAGPELVPPDVGRLVLPDDPRALAGAVRDLLDRPPGRDRLVEAASRFDIARTAAGVEAVYEELVP